MRIYIAAGVGSIPRLRSYRNRLIEMGHVITSSWLDEGSWAQPEGMSYEIFETKMAWRDLCEAKAADLIILDTLKKGAGRGGKHVEWGIGLGGFQSKMLYLVGPVRNVFNRLADRKFKNWEECLEALKAQHG